MPLIDLPVEFGQIDIYLFDQLLKGRIEAGMAVLDAGCGSGRNIHYLLRAGCRVYGADSDPGAIGAVRHLARSLAPLLPTENFRAEPLESLSFSASSMDVVLCIAVLHFARDEAHFDRMLRGAWRVLRPGGMLVSRLASSTGIETEVRCVGGRRYILPDGSQRYLVDDALLRALTVSLGGELLDPLKTTVVHGHRAMSTWVVRKASSP